MKTSGAVKAFISLGHESRLEIYKLLTHKEKPGMSAGDISKHFDIPGATLSFHLTQMVNSKLIEAHKEGRTIYYSVRFKRLKKLISYLDNSLYKNKHERSNGDIEIQSIRDTED